MVYNHSLPIRSNSLLLSIQYILYTVWKVIKNWNLWEVSDYIVPLEANQDILFCLDPVGVGNRHWHDTFLSVGYLLNQLNIFFPSTCIHKPPKNILCYVTIWI